MSSPDFFTPNPEGPQHERYRELVAQLKLIEHGPLMDQVWGQIEAIKNQFGGYPPPYDK